MTNFKRTYLIIIITLSGLNCLLAQSETERVRRAVLDYVDAFYTGDSSLIQKSVSPTVYKVGYFIPKGKTVYESEPMTFQQMIDYANSVKARKRFRKPGTIKEVEVFEVTEQIASAKLTAWWGFDYMLLAKKNGKWMIDQVLYVNPPRKKKN